MCENRKAWALSHIIAGLLYAGFFVFLHFVWAAEYFARYVDGGGLAGVALRSYLWASFSLSILLAVSGIAMWDGSSWGHRGLIVYAAATLTLQGAVIVVKLVHFSHSWAPVVIEHSLCGLYAVLLLSARFFKASAWKQGGDG